MRNPVTLWDNLGAGGFLIFQLVVGGGVMTALVHLLFVFLLALDVLAQLADPEAIEASESLLTALHGTTLIAGYLISGLIGVIGLARRKLLNCAWALAFMPFYWILLSIAACRALVQLIRDPYRWEKTQHGLARHSRLANAHKVSR